MIVDNNEERGRENHDFMSLITVDQRESVLDDVQQWYEECAGSGYRYEWPESDGSFGVRREPYAEEREFEPSPDEWLGELTGRRDLYGWSNYDDEVFELCKANVWEAYRQRFGDDWLDDGELNDAACEVEMELHEWVVSRLREPTSDESFQGGKSWKAEGF